MDTSTALSVTLAVVIGLPLLAWVVARVVATAWFKTKREFRERSE